jgi:hypothetical protein
MLPNANGYFFRTERLPPIINIGHFDFYVTIKNPDPLIQLLIGVLGKSTNIVFQVVWLLTSRSVLNRLHL